MSLLRWACAMCVLFSTTVTNGQTPDAATHAAASKTLPENHQAADQETGLLVPADLALDQILREPLVANPLYLNFDARGRLWVVQFRQYPWPAGLQLISRDNVWRNVYQPAFPPPPPHALDSPFRGQDRITIHEDTDGDGVFDQHQVFLDGLNLATAALPGRGGVYVMNPPYLLFYADANEDDIPDSLTPRILLSGFGIEDTHSIANSLRWGPDGWIYGTQGSTVSAAIVHHGPDNQPLATPPPIHSMGQHLWRYHPEQHRYEIFAEGGGNAFGVEFDGQGRVYSGHNGGDTRGFHYVQGGYYLKNFGKHGSHSNPFVFGFYPAMRHHSAPRFSHTFKIYEADGLPAKYHGQLFAVSPILHEVMASNLSADGSTRQTIDLGPVVTASSQPQADWFTPVDIQTGPDGSLYIADWYSSQSNHYRNHEGQTNPDLGRVYRLRSATDSSFPVFDLRTWASHDLVERGLTHPNRWYRETALRLLGDRRDPHVVPLLKSRATSQQNPHALEALWALHQSAGLDDATAQQLLVHSQAAVRRWTVQLLGDRFHTPNHPTTTPPTTTPSTAENPPAIAADVAAALLELAGHEPNVEVRLQLACSARRLPATVGLPILGRLMRNTSDAGDPLLPLALWWGIEVHAADHPAILEWLADFQASDLPMADTIQLLPRLIRRSAMLGSQEELRHCARLLDLATTAEQTQAWVAGLAEAFSGRPLPPLPTELVTALSRVEGRYAVILGIRQGDAQAQAAGIRLLRDQDQPIEQREAVILALGEVRAEVAIPSLQQLLDERPTDRLALACLVALQNFDRPELGPWLVERAARMSPAVWESAQSVLASRAGWARTLLQAVATEAIAPESISPETLARISWHRDPQLQAERLRLFPTPETENGGLEAQIERIEQIVLAGNGNPLAGQKLYHGAANCGKCHVVFGRGGDIGPDLTSYQRSQLRSLLLAVVHPDAEIREGFETVTVLTDEGQVLSGLKVDEDPQRLVLRSADGQTTSIPTDQIDERLASPNSLMPRGLLDGLSDSEIRDLFAFLTSTTPPN